MDWKTDSVALAAFLSLSHEVLRYTWEESSHRGGSCFWYFEDTEELADDVANYFGGVASVDPKDYNDAYGTRKREMFQVKDARVAK